MRRLIFGVGVCAAAAVGAAPPVRTAAPAVTFTKDVAPILHARCVTCHRAGEVAPMSLITYQEARPYARAIRDRVVSRAMPPWFADPHFGSFANDARLSQKEIDTIAAWVDAGAPQGDAKDMPAAPRFTDGWQLGEPDLVVELPEVQIPAAMENGGDYFPTPNIKLDLTEDRWIRALEIRPSNKEVTHHSVIFSTPAGSVMGPSGVFDVLGVWAVGTAPTQYPDGQGRWLRKGQMLRTNLHYHPNGKPQVDRTRIGFYFGKGELKKEVVAGLAGNIAFAIPPQASDYEMRAAWIADQDVDVVSLFPHMHLRGKDMTMTATYPGGKSETLLSVPNYDFNWQLFYYPKTRIRLVKGTRVDLVAHYDNSSANKRNPDPNRRVTFGEASTAEMMFGMFEYTAADGVSPKPSTSKSRMDALLSSFKDSAYAVDIVRPRLTIPSVLYIPQSGDGAWYVPTFGMIFVSPITPVWTGKTFEFEGVLHVGAGPGDPPFTVKGARLGDGSINASVESIDGKPVPMAEFTGHPQPR
ncbi:MAG TPA: cytochrome c [Vicinamibacterales bacterium]|nr:cytochrome c [Vicinamibacterales bacterium]